MTQEEIIQAISDDKMMPFIQPEQLAGIVDFVIKNYKPSLPSDVDEAAHKFAVLYDQGTCDGIAQECFIAGAKWMAEQGVSEEYDTDEDGMILLDSDMLGLNITACTPSELHCKDGDCIVIQIRKKQ